MALYAISDLHLDLSRQRGMDRFGNLWIGHTARLAKAWQESIKEDDVVLIPGDISWAMRSVDFIPDMEFLHKLPGEKILSRGNHDYFWQSNTKMAQLLPADIVALERSFCIRQGYCICAVKGWLTPGASLYETRRDEKYFIRERGRLTRTLEQAVRIGLPLLVMMHFPPFAYNGDIGFTDILEQFKVSICIYGHLHSGAWQEQRGGIYNGISYMLVSADFLEFRPLKVA